MNDQPAPQLLATPVLGEISSQVLRFWPSKKTDQCILILICQMACECVSRSLNQPVTKPASQPTVSQRTNQPTSKWVNHAVILLCPYYIYIAQLGRGGGWGGGKRALLLNCGALISANREMEICVLNKCSVPRFWAGSTATPPLMTL